MKKIQKIIDIALQKRDVGVIVIALSMWTNCVYSAEESFPEGGGAAVGVRVRLGDATRQREQSRVRRALAEKDEALRKAQQENLTLRHQNELLRRELLSTTEKFQQQNEMNRALQYVVAGSLANGEMRKPGDREGSLAESLYLISTSGQTFAVKVAKFCELTEKLLGEVPFGKVRQLEMQLFMEELKRANRQFNTLAGGAVKPQKIEECDILKVDRDLAVVVLSAGSVHGVFNGLVFRSGQAELQVIAVRPHLSAAAVTAGRMEALSPGMKASAGEKKQ